MADDATQQTQEALRQSEEWLHESQSVAGIGSYSLDIRSGVWTASHCLNSLLGIDTTFEHTLTSWNRLVHADDRAMMADYFASEVVGKCRHFDKEYRITRPSDGEIRWVHGLGQLDLDLRGSPWRMRGTIQEITDRKLADMRLQLAASVFTNAQESIIITSADGSILDVNDKFTLITGYSREEVIGRNPRIFQSGLHTRDFYEAMWGSLRETGQWSGEVWNRTKRGTVFPQMLTISAVRDSTGVVQHYVALAFDVSALKEREERLEHLALYDPLTGLPNRVFLADKLQQAMARSRRRTRNLAVAYLDLDSFKTVNDTHGHEVGDRLLKVVAKRMKRVMRDGDTLARLGGDEFVAVFLDLENAASSRPVIDRLLESVAQPIRIGDLVLHISSSIGVTFYSHTDEVDADQLLRQADHAMYESKLSSQSRFSYFDESRDRTIRGRSEAIERIQRGMAAHEFVLYYQPKVNMRSGAVIGAEALIRWQHPERGLLLPADFLPTIENHPLDVKLGEWVIDTALTQIGLWHEIGLDIPVSVNIDAMQLQQTNFVDRLAALLAAHPLIDPSRLQLEILETGALMNVTEVSKTLNRCIELGVSFALDDFGAGYSSLIYLKRLPARVLKIDQSFVRNILNDPEDLSVLEGLLRLATAFRRELIAEGVESAELGWMLLYMGCELAQGFGIARPMAPHLFPKWAAQWTPDPSWADALSIKSDDRPRVNEGIEALPPLSAIDVDNRPHFRSSPVIH
jgi:diguanylate cyclase (GGDEF)-like protein/PAS domain S-box-containing protein